MEDLVTREVYYSDLIIKLIKNDNFDLKKIKKKSKKYFLEKFKFFGFLLKIENNFYIYIYTYFNFRFREHFKILPKIS